MRITPQARKVSIVVHDVVGVDEVYRHEPGLVIGSQLLTLTAQPAPGTGRNYIIVEVATLGMPDDIANAKIVRKPIRLHFGGHATRYPGAHGRHSGARQKFSP